MNLFERYKQLPRNVRLYIGISTLLVAVAGDQWTKKIEENTQIRAEAEKRLQWEMEKQQEQSKN